MPVWLIELFGARELDRAFYLIAFMTAPAWLAMLLFPGSRVVRRLADPLLLSSVFSVVLVVLLWKFHEASILSLPLFEPDYGGAVAVTRDPAIFLIVFCNLQILNLALGGVLFQAAARAGFRAPVELVLCWVGGVLALPPFVAHLVWRRRFRR